MLQAGKTMVICTCVFVKIMVMLLRKGEKVHIF